mgnify:CR=1 FL=1
MVPCYNPRIKRLGAALLAIVIIVSCIGPTKMFAAKIAERDTSAVSESAGTDKTPDYAEYCSQHHAEEAAEQSIIVIDAVSFSDDQTQRERYTNFEGQSGESVLLPEGGKVTYPFSVEKDGYYTLQFLYYPISGSGNTILQDILIDGQLPFSESSAVSFERRWINSDTTLYDRNQNQIRSRQEEQPTWMIKSAMDSSGAVSGPLKYYLTAGEHALTLSSLREPMLLRSVTFFSYQSVMDYQQKKEEYKKLSYQAVSNSVKTISFEAESNAVKSDQSMYPLADRSSPTVSPYSASKILYNTVGGAQWKTVGQWLEWSFEVTETGLYEIAFHFKQNKKSDAVSIRELYIDGEIPFAEAENITFPYASDWQTEALSDRNGEAYQFYLEKGTHTLRLRAALGQYQEILNETDDCFEKLNRIYRKIITITGTEPDIYRDYQFELLIPETLEEMLTLIDEMKALEQGIRDLNFSGNQGTDAIKRIYTQLFYMTEKPAEIAKRLTTYQSAISSLGTWRNTMSEQPLTLDKIYIGAPGMTLPKGEAGFLASMKHYFMQFVYSFFSDYSAVGTIDSETDESITVWMTTGRDQAQILKQLINDRFTPEKGIGVSLELVSADSLLPALLANTGPDVSLGMIQSDPVNLALRNALTDLSAFSDYSEVQNRFSQEANIPFQFKDGFYALPETQSYYMMFYRKDILEELNISTVDIRTWSSLLKKVLPVLQKKALNIGVQMNINSYLMFFYQLGGSLYNSDLTTSGLGSAEAVQAMQTYQALYTQYGLQLAFDFANRFRSGEMPIAIVDYLSYNQLTVFAPEIKGLWGMMPVPGTEQKDGTISCATPSIVTGAALMASADNQEAGWEFLKWWTSAETQSTFGRDLESVVGSAARYNSANLEAIDSVAWDFDIKQQLKAQQEQLKAFPEAPGGYYTSRHYDFAFRSIVYEGENVRKALKEAAANIDKELAKKQKEFSLN